MDIVITAVVPASGATADLRLTAPAGSPAAPVLAALRRALGVTNDAPLRRGGVLIPAEGAVEDTGLVSGATVSVDDAAPPATAPAAVELVAIRGPDSGRRHPLRRGRHV